jgi:hypothetical protein
MFEFFFKYSPSAFSKGHLVFLASWPLWILALLVIAAGAGLYYHVRRNHGLLTGTRPIVIWLLETALVALILLLLWHPALSVATLRPQQNVITVLVDHSRSMGITEHGTTRLSQALDLWKDKLAARFALSGPGIRIRQRGDPRHRSLEDSARFAGHAHQ